jgi:8-oxo-dGTP diphosphatase
MLGCVMQLVGCSTGAPRHEASEGDSANQQVMEEYQYHYKYPHPSVTTDCVIFGFDGNAVKVLLIERGGEPYKGCWAFPGGFLEMEESAEEGAKRELMEETDLTTAFVKQFHAFSAPDRDPRERVLTIAYYSLVRLSEVKGMDDAKEAKWFALDEVPKLAFDHDEMLRLAKEDISKEIRLATKDWQELTRGFSPEEVKKIEDALR